MSNKKPIIREIVAYSKDTNEYLKSYSLNNISLEELREIFNVSKTEKDPMLRDLIACYDIDKETGKKLEPFIDAASIDWDECLYFLECSKE